MTQSTFRRIALGMSGAVEGSHMSHPDFRANGRIFATLHADKKHGTVKLTPVQQAVFLEEHPTVFSPAAGAWGRQGYTMILLAAAEEEVVGEAVTLAWKNTAEKTARKPATKRKARAKQ